MWKKSRKAGEQKKTRVQGIEGEERKEWAESHSNHPESHPGVYLNRFPDKNGPWAPGAHSGWTDRERYPHTVKLKRTTGGGVNMAVWQDAEIASPHN